MDDSNQLGKCLILWRYRTWLELLQENSTLIASYIFPKNSNMYLKNINGKRILVLNFNTRSVRRDFQIFKTFASSEFLTQIYFLFMWTRNFSSPQNSTILRRSRLISANWTVLSDSQKNNVILTLYWHFLP